MSDTDQKVDEKKGDEILARMLKTPPKPKLKSPKETPQADINQK